MIYPSEFGFSLIKNVLMDIYGERGSCEHNLRRYMHSTEWALDCRIVENVQQIPTLNIDQIKQQIQWESAMQKKALTMQRFVQSYSGKLTDDDYYSLASEMGLAPSQCPWEETLFPHVLDLWVSSDEESREIQSKVEKHKKQIAYMGNIMMDYLSDRQLVSYKQPGTDKRRILFSQGYGRNFYRGENAFYGQSRPSLYRKISEDPQEATVQRLIGFTRISEFSLWINKLKCVKHWHSDTFHGAIAQHYGIPTNGIDITSDLKVALFFACCSYEQSSHSWRPLKKEEFEKNNSRPDVACLGGDSRYGVIFSAPADISFLSREVDDPALHFACPTPVGYQPFMRCAAQSAYIIEAGEPYNLYRDATFSKHKFLLSEEICQWIFHEMQQGDSIYPREGLNNFEACIDMIKKSKVYSREALKLALNFYDFNFTEDEAKNLLYKAGYTCTKNPPWDSETILHQIDSTYGFLDNTLQFTV